MTHAPTKTIKARCMGSSLHRILATVIRSIIKVAASSKKAATNRLRFDDFPLNNQLISFTEEMRYATSLHELYVGNNQLTSFPAEMAHAQALTNLDLGHNLLTSFPAALDQARKMASLMFRKGR